MADVDTQELRWLQHEVLEVLVEGLNYLDNVDAIKNLTSAADISAAISGAVKRYQNDAIFRARVTTLEAHLWQRTSLFALLDELDKLRAERDQRAAEVARLTGELEAANQHVKVLRKQIADDQREFQREAREIAAEARMQERMGDDYGSY